MPSVCSDPSAAHPCWRGGICGRWLAASCTKTATTTKCERTIQPQTSCAFWRRVLSENFWEWFCEHGWGAGTGEAAGKYWVWVWVGVWKTIGWVLTSSCAYPSYDRQELGLALPFFRTTSVSSPRSSTRHSPWLLCGTPQWSELIGLRGKQCTINTRMDVQPVARWWAQEIAGRTHCTSWTGHGVLAIGPWGFPQHFSFRTWIAIATIFR